jgi:hypothetical protein
MSFSGNVALTPSDDDDEDGVEDLNSYSRGIQERTASDADVERQAAISR